MTHVEQNNDSSGKAATGETGLSILLAYRTLEASSEAGGSVISPFCCPSVKSVEVMNWQDPRMHLIKVVDRLATTTLPLPQARTMTLIRARPAVKANKTTSQQRGHRTPAQDVCRTIGLACGVAPRLALGL